MQCEKRAKALSKQNLLEGFEINFHKLQAGGIEPLTVKQEEEDQ